MTGIERMLRRSMAGLELIGGCESHQCNLRDWKSKDGKMERSHGLHQTEDGDSVKFEIFCGGKNRPGRWAVPDSFIHRTTPRELLEAATKFECWTGSAMAESIFSFDRGICCRSSNHRVETLIAARNGYQSSMIDD
jgi:hypothetical protein